MKQRKARLMSAMTWERWSAVCGILWVLLTFVGLNFVGDLPDGNDTAEMVATYYADSGNRGSVVIGSYFMAVTGVLFIVFLGGLHRRLRESIGADSQLPTVMLISGTVYAALFFDSMALRASIAGVMTLDTQQQPSADVSMLLPWLGWLLLRTQALVAAVPLLVTTGIIVRRTDVFPRWLGWLSLVLGVLLPLGGPFWPLSLLPIWILAVSIVQLVRPRTRTVRQSASLEASAPA